VTDHEFEDRVVGLTTYAGRVEQCEHCGEPHDWHVDFSKAPEPFDGTPKPTVTISAVGMRALREISGDHPYGVGIADEGEAYMTVLLYDAEGKVIDYRTVFPDGGYPTKAPL
jgi:hypothetical protein